MASRPPSPRKPASIATASTMSPQRKRSANNSTTSRKEPPKNMVIRCRARPPSPPRATAWLALSTTKSKVPTPPPHAPPAPAAGRGRPPGSRLQRRFRRSQLFRQARPLPKRPGALHRPLSPPVESVPGGAQHPRPRCHRNRPPNRPTAPLNAFKNTGLQNEPKKWGGMHNTHPGPKSPAPSPQPRARKRPNPQPPLINSIEPNAQNRTPLRHGIYLPPRPSGPHQLP